MEGTSQPVTVLGPSGGYDEALELGATLKEMRVALKRGLDDVADELRIRPAYLQAIEEGRFNDLPGTTYALGFVRAYAEALGLDPEDAARRFKSATGGGTPQPNLVLPAPVPSGGLPTGAVLLVAAILAVLAYGGWYVMSTQGRDPGAIVAALPDRIVSAVRDVLPARPAEEPPAPQAAMSTAPPATSNTQAMAPASGAQTAAPAVETPAPSASSVADTLVAERVEANETPAEEEDVPPPLPERVVNAVPPPLSSSPAATPPKPPEPTAQAALSPPPPPPAPVTTTSASAAPGPSTAPASPGMSHRIVLVARADSWIELRDPSGAPVYSRVLRKDERYEVPDVDGLTMMTGNAGGLEVLVDGRIVPALGVVGAVKRNIAMDANRLRAGTAVPPAPESATSGPAAAQP